jgi:excisionase family DNA binding protein
VKRRAVRACYGVPELAELMGLSRWQLYRMLQRRHVPMTREGRHLVVWLSDLQTHAPEAFESLILVQASRPAA